VVITRPHVHVHDADLSRRERDSLVLTAEERRWGRRRVTTQAGRTLALALPTGSMLTPGDILHVAIDWYVVIEAAPEAVLAVIPLGDGLFPAGGFAHSFGLETYAQEGRVRDRAGLEAFVTAHLEGAAGPGDAVAVAVATRLATAGDLAAWCELDARVDAMKAVPEFRAASRQMGRQTARVAAALGDDAFLTGVARAIDERL